MSIAFVDTDVLIRLLTGDDVRKQAAAAALFAKVETGHLTVRAPVSVIADAVYVLHSRKLYGLDRNQVSALLTGLVRLESFRVDQRRDVLRALDVFATKNVDFGDALVIAAAERASGAIVYSYDRDFDGIAGLERREP